MTLKEADRKRENPVPAAAAEAWLHFLRWRREAHTLIQRIEDHAAEKSRVEELGKEAGRKYSGLLEEWNQRVHPHTRLPRESCPEQPPERFLNSLQEPERPLFEEDYRLWIEGQLWKTRADRAELQSASGAFRLWLQLPSAPVSFFAAEQLQVEDWHDRRQELENQAKGVCRKFVDLVPSVKDSLPLIRVKQIKPNEAAALRALQTLDKAAALAGNTRGEPFSLLKELAGYAEELQDVLWRTEYGSQLSGELAKQVLERALDCGELSEKHKHGQLQTNLAHLLDREGIPVPQHWRRAVLTWTEAYENPRSWSRTKVILSKWWRDALGRRQRRQACR